MRDSLNEHARYTEKGWKSLLIQAQKSLNLHQ